MIGREGWVYGGWSFPVPRTHVLADVATEHVVAYAGTHLFRNRAAEFNGEVGDTAAGVECEIGTSWNYRLCGAGIDAAGAGAASIGWRLIRFEVERYELLAQEKPGSLSLIDKTSVFSYPAQAA